MKKSVKLLPFLLSIFMFFAIISPPASACESYDCITMDDSKLLLLVDTASNVNILPLSCFHGDRELMFRITENSTVRCTVHPNCQIRVTARVDTLRCRTCNHIWNVRTVISSIHDWLP